jgi:hypothetical protein
MRHPSREDVWRFVSPLQRRSFGGLQVNRYPNAAFDVQTQACALP